MNHETGNHRRILLHLNPSSPLDQLLVLAFSHALQTLHGYAPITNSLIQTSGWVVENAEHFKIDMQPYTLLDETFKGN